MTELVHIRQLHSYDNILIELFLALFWFNPFMWLLKNAMRDTHEYLADSRETKGRSGESFIHLPH